MSVSFFVTDSCSLIPVFPDLSLFAVLLLSIASHFSPDPWIDYLWTWTGISCFCIPNSSLLLMSREDLTHGCLLQDNLSGISSFESRNGMKEPSFLSLPVVNFVCPFFTLFWVWITQYSSSFQKSCLSWLWNCFEMMIASWFTERFYSEGKAYFHAELQGRDEEERYTHVFYADTCYPLFALSSKQIL